MLTCKQSSQLISQSLDRPLSWSDRVQLRLHLFLCNACKRFKHQLNQICRAVQRATQYTEDDHAIELPIDAKVRIAQEMTNAVESKNS